MKKIKTTHKSAIRQAMNELGVNALESANPANHHNLSPLCQYVYASWLRSRSYIRKVDRRKLNSEITIDNVKVLANHILAS